jgi:flagellar hook protein FlgE
MAIDGDGFFVVQGQDGQQYTRAGSFTLNANHQLVTAGGAYVQGYGVDASSNVVVGKLQSLTIPLGSQLAAKATANVQMQGTLDTSGKVATGASVFMTQSIQESGGVPISTTSLLTNVESVSNPGFPLFSTAPGSNVLTLTATKGTGASSISAQFTVTPTSTVQDLLDFYNGSLGIDASSAPPPPAPAPGAALGGSAGDQIVITGNVGTVNALNLSTDAFRDSTTAPFTFTADPTQSASGEGVTTSLTAYDSLGQPVTVKITAVLESKTSGQTTWRFFASSPDNQNGNQVVGNGLLTFDGTGKLIGSTGTNITLDRSNTGADPTLDIKLDFADVAAAAHATSTMSLEQQDGEAPGELQGFAIGTDGIITGTYSNGLTKSLGQIVLAKFNNPEGLVDNGGNMYSAGANSGTAIIGPATTLGMGKIRGESLEQSNVDLSSEFINMIVASTGFSAASRVITTSNQMLTDLLNSSR